MDFLNLFFYVKGGRVRGNLVFKYGGQELEIVTKFSYLGVIFLSPGGSFYHTFETLSGQALKAIFKLKSYFYKFTNITAEHKLNLFDKLILPILNYGRQVCFFSDSQKIELVHLKFCKHILGVRSQTQNNVIYSEFRQISHRKYC